MKNKKIIKYPILILTVFCLFFGFTTTTFAENYCDKYKGSWWKGSFKWDVEGCNADEKCVIAGGLITRECVSITSERAEEQEADKKIAENVIVGLNCPTGSYPYTSNTSQSTIVNLLYSDSSSPQGCLNPRYDTKKSGVEACLEYGKSNTAYNKKGEIIGCWVVPIKIIRESDMKLQQTDISKLTQGETTYVPKIEIPCNTNIAGGACPTNWKTDIASYIARLYQFSLMIAGLIALGAIMYGAVLYTLSAGNFVSKEEGKEWMKNAVYGLVLLFGAYLILYTINPDLVKLKTPTLPAFDLDTLLPPEPVYVSDDGLPSALQENPGGSGILGCAASVGGGGGIFEINLKTDKDSLNSDPNTMKCTNCKEGNDPKDFTSAAKTASEGMGITFMKCECKSGLFRMPDGTCTNCVGGAIISKDRCVLCSDFTGLAQNIPALQSKLEPMSEGDRIIIMNDCKNEINKL